MKVKTFTDGLAGGYKEAFRRLDECVASLGATKIYSVTDTHYPKRELICGNQGDAHIARVVVYE